MLFPNAKRINSKVSVPPIINLWKRFQMSSSHELIGKKAKASRDSVFKLWSLKASCSGRDIVFYISAFKNTVLAICW